jgi:hypothetical protein
MFSFLSVILAGSEQVQGQLVTGKWHVLGSTPQRDQGRANWRTKPSSQGRPHCGEVNVGLPLYLATTLEGANERRDSH